MILVIDNYDSFTYNLVQYLGEMGAELDVRRNDTLTVADVAELAPEKILISPGPGTPDDAGITLDLIREFGPKTPIFGVCLGQQAIGQALGGRVVRAEKLMHGKTSLVRHTGQGVFHGLPSPLEATRYHSLVVERASLPDVLEITAESDDGEIMGLKHKSWPLEGVQFHPESVLTEHGKQMLRNFLEPITMNLYEKRLSRVRTAMHENGLDTLILTPGAAMRYLTGFSEHGSRFLALVVPDDQPWLFVTPALNAEQARQNPAGVADIRVWDDAQGWEGLLAQLSKDLMLDIGIVGLDDDMPARFTLKIQELMPTALLKLAGAALAPLRAVKDALELAALQRAAEATDALIPVAYDACRVGVKRNGDRPCHRAKHRARAAIRTRSRRLSGPGRTGPRRTTTRAKQKSRPAMSSFWTSARWRTATTATSRAPSPSARRRTRPGASTTSFTRPIKPASPPCSPARPRMT